MSVNIGNGKLIAVYYTPLLSEEIGQ